MNYKEAIKYIDGTGKFGINPGLSRIQRLLELMGNPEKKLNVIHVAGTNGKGSTTTFISEILKKNGYSVGIYTSPYIERFTERIKIGDYEISEEDVAALVTEIEPFVNQVAEEGLDHPTEFELITACAFKYFYDKKVDYVVLEVGLGGRFDATNVVIPLLSVITTISFDHMNILGNTLGEIAVEKAGIIKQNVPVVVYPQQEEAWKVIKQKAEDMKSQLYCVSEAETSLLYESYKGIEFEYKFRDIEFKNLKLKMAGGYQLMNAATALTAIAVLKEVGVRIEDRAVYEGLEASRWPGRFEVIEEEPFIVLDGGHNIQGIYALADSVSKYFSGRKIHVVCGMLRDKDYIHMLQKLFTISSSFITVTPDSPRALTSEELAEEIINLGKEAKSASSIENAVEEGLGITAKEEVLIFCGSLYMIGRARTILREKLKK